VVEAPASADDLYPFRVDLTNKYEWTKKKHLPLNECPNPTEAYTRARGTQLVLTPRVGIPDESE
jgi:hypothetical protein